jgi:hypothetical protein
MRIKLADGESAGRAIGQGPGASGGGVHRGGVRQLFPQRHAANGEQSQRHDIGKQPGQRTADLVRKAGQRRMDSRRIMGFGRIGRNGMHQTPKRYRPTFLQTLS